MKIRLTTKPNRSRYTNEELRAEANRAIDKARQALGADVDEWTLETVATGLMFPEDDKARS